MTNPCTVTVELIPNTTVVRVMLRVGNGGSSKAMPIGEFDDAQRAGAVATFVLGAVSAAYVAGIEDAHARALEALTKFGKE